MFFNEFIGLTFASGTRKCDDIFTLCSVNDRVDNYFWTVVKTRIKDLFHLEETIKRTRRMPVQRDEIPYP